MRYLVVNPARYHTSSWAGHCPLWTSWTCPRQPPSPSTTPPSTAGAARASRHRPSLIFRKPSSSQTPRYGPYSSTAAAAAPAAPIGALDASLDMASPAAAEPFHVLACCRTPEDVARVQAVAKEVAASAKEAQGPTGLATAPLEFHLEPSTVPPYAVPALDAAGCARRLAQRPPPADGGGGGGTRTMGRVLLAAATLGSTQELLRSHGSALGDGAVAVADRQTSGKGRGGNQWTSPLGCLMFSALRRLRVSSPAQAPFINYLVCLAITRGVRRALQESGLPPLDLRIKWPNDIYSGGVKVAGALIHTTWQGGSFNVITGIGLNVNNRTPTTCLDELLERAAAGAAAAAGTGSDPAPAAAAAAAAAAAPSVHITREAVLTGILAALEDVYDTFEQHGFAPLEAEYLATWLHSGQELDFDDSDPSRGGGPGSPPGRVVRLTLLGLSPSGFLLAEDRRGGAEGGGGGRYELTPDGNSLDMMQGLIRRKIQ